MDVDAPQPGIVQNLLGEDPAIGRHHDEVGLQLADGLQGGAVPELGGLEHRNVVDLGAHLHRGGLELHPPVLGLVRLAEHPHHLVAGGHQGLQGGHGKIRRAHEDDAHQSSSSLMWPSISSGVSSRSILSM